MCCMNLRRGRYLTSGDRDKRIRRIVRASVLRRLCDAPGSATPTVIVLLPFHLRVITSHVENHTKHSHHLSMIIDINVLYSVRQYVLG